MRTEELKLRLEKNEVWILIGILMISFYNLNKGYNKIIHLILIIIAFIYNIYKGNKIYKLENGIRYNKNI